MINNLLSLLTYENIYLIANYGIIPFWLLLIFIPNHQITNFFTQSVVAPLLLAASYAYLSYLVYQEGNILDGFELYDGLDGLYSMFSNEALLLIFWLHFLAVSLFAGSWIVRDGRKYFIPKIKRNVCYTFHLYNFVLQGFTAIDTLCPLNVRT